jgi:hypothetical protein
MHMLRITLVTAALALGIHGSAYSADANKSTRSPASDQDVKATGTQSDRPASAAGTQSQDTRQESTRTDAKGSPSERPAAAAGTQNTDQQTYQAEMKKCDAMNNSADKQNCADKAKKDHGQM